MARAKPASDAVTFHSQVAPSFHASYQSNPNRKDRMAIWRDLIVRFGRGSSLAYDVGCGPGVFSCELARVAKRVVAIDGADGMLDQARKLAAQKNLSNISFLKHRLPNPLGRSSDPAGLVICSSVLEYLDSLDDGLRFLRSLTVPGGIIIFSISNKQSISRLVVRLVYTFTRRPKYFGLLRHFVTLDGIKSRLDKHELDYVDGGYSDGAGRLDAALSPVFPRRFVNKMIYVVARRRY